MTIVLSAIQALKYCKSSCTSQGIFHWYQIPLCWSIAINAISFLPASIRARTKKTKICNFMLGQTINIVFRIECTIESQKSQISYLMKNTFLDTYRTINLFQLILFDLIKIFFNNSIEFFIELGGNDVCMK